MPIGQSRGIYKLLKMIPDLLLISLPAIILLGIASSYTDIRYGKIRNMHSLLAMGYGILALGVSGLMMYLTGEKINLRYYLDFAINLGISIGISFAVWSTGLLSAGDLKLFVAYATLVPLSSYSYGYVELFPASILLINTFVPLFLFLFFYILKNTSWSDKRRAIKSTLEPKKLFFFAVAIFGLSWIISLIMRYVRFIPSDYFSMILLLFGLVYAAERIFKLRFNMLCIGLAIIRLVFDIKAFLSAEFYVSFLVLFVSMLVMRMFILELARDIFSKEIRFRELKEGMILAEAPIRQGESKTERKVYYDLLSYFQEKLSDDSKRGEARRGVSHQILKEEIEEIRGILGDGADEMTVRVHSTMPFAPFIFFGVILTIMIRGNLFSAASAAIAKLAGL